MSIPKAKTIFHWGAVIVFVFVFLMGAISVNLLAPIYELLINHFALASPASIMLEEAAYILIGAITTVIWGYLVDKVNRKRTLQVSLAFLILGFFICAVAQPFWVFILGRMIGAIGYGALMPIVYSLLADYIPARFWASTFGLMAFTNSMGNIIGNFLSGFITPLNIWSMGWQFSFLLLAFITSLLSFIVAFIAVPQRGASMIETIDANMGMELREGKRVYPFTISKEDIKPIWNIKTNRRIVILTFFAVIPGTVMTSFLVYYFSSYPFASFPELIKIQMAMVFSGAVGLGYFLGTVGLGPFFDNYYKNALRKRAKFTYVTLMLSIPLLIVAFVFITPVDFGSLNLGFSISEAQVLDFSVYYKITAAILLQYPGYTAYLILLFFGSFFVASIIVNRSPSLLNVNLPEHMGTTQALMNFSEQFGKGFTLIFLAFQYLIFDLLFQVVDGKILLILSVVWYFVPLVLWRQVSRGIDADIGQKSSIIRKRTQEARISAQDSRSGGS